MHKHKKFSYPGIYFIKKGIFMRNKVWQYLFNDVVSSLVYIKMKRLGSFNGKS